MAPHPAPFPSPESSRSSPLPQGFVVPSIPPCDCPLSITIDATGHRRLPLVSTNPLPADHERVTAKCANCTEMAIDCEFSEAGVPCPPCAILGIPDCQFADSYHFMDNLRHHRDTHFCRERDVLCTAVCDNQLAPSSFEREYENACAWFYSAAQGAISRFLINCHSTNGLVYRGYQVLAASFSDAGLLSRFLAFGNDVCIHPSVLRIVVDRLQALFLSYLE
ncbi:hypothetical protein C8R44DRAFT_729667 [Mycena epipterygia]|nr:hypothetical protein C8R44DRAFT_729667 [Mycena epipterygia]